MAIFFERNYVNGQVDSIRKCRLSWYITAGFIQLRIISCILFECEGEVLSNIKVQFSGIQ